MAAASSPSSSSSTVSDINDVDRKDGSSASDKSNGQDDLQLLLSTELMSADPPARATRPGGIVVRDADGAAQLLGAFARCQQSGTVHADVVLRVSHRNVATGQMEITRLPGHRFVLAAQSGYFDKQLRGPTVAAPGHGGDPMSHSRSWDRGLSGQSLGHAISVPQLAPPSRSGVMELDIDGLTTDLELFQNLLAFCYGGLWASSLSVHNVYPMWRLATQYEVHGLPPLCIRLMRVALGPESAVRWLCQAAADGGQAAEIYQLCRSFITTHTAAVLDSKAFERELVESELVELVRSNDMAVDEMHLFRAVVRWATWLVFQSNNSKTSCLEDHDGDVDMKVAATEPRQPAPQSGSLDDGDTAMSSTAPASTTLSLGRPGGSGTVGECKASVTVDQLKLRLQRVLPHLRLGLLTPAELTQIAVEWPGLFDDSRLFAALVHASAEPAKRAAVSLAISAWPDDARLRNLPPASIDKIGDDLTVAQLAGGRATATYKGGSSMVFIVGRSPVTTGIHAWRIGVEQLPLGRTKISSIVYIGITAMSFFYRLGPDGPAKSEIAWDGSAATTCVNAFGFSSDGYKVTAGKEAYAPPAVSWQAGDRIDVRFDCVSRRLSAIHLRTLVKWDFDAVPAAAVAKGLVLFIQIPGGDATAGLTFSCAPLRLSEYGCVPAP